jgi:hypothetical protein
VDLSAEGAVRVNATVVAVLLEFGQSVVRTDDGYQLTITGRSSGLPWDTLHEGQRVVCVVEGRLARVLKVELPG